jgi:hypothetical protein
MWRTTGGNTKLIVVGGEWKKTRMRVILKNTKIIVQKNDSFVLTSNEVTMINDQ